MKKIKKINKLLSSLILLSPLSTIGFNNQYEKQKAIVIKNNTTNNYANLNAQQVQMGDITVTVEGTTITEYYSGEGTLLVSSNITSIGDSAFNSRESIYSLDLSQATSLITIDDSSFSETTLLSGKLTIPSSVTTIGPDAFNGSGITELDLSNAKYLQNLYDNAFKGTKIKDFISTPETNQNFSLVTNLGPNAKVLISGNSGIWNESSKPVGALAFGKIVVPTNFKNIKNFQGTYISSLNLSQATSLTTIDQNAFSDCRNLTGDITIPSSVTTIGDVAFWRTKITSLNLAQATSLTTINRSAFEYCLNLKGNLIIPSNVKTIKGSVFANGTTFDNLYFLSETPSTSFWTYWQPTITGKVYVPSEIAKEAYLGAPNFGFNADQIEIGLPPKPSKSNTGLILGLLFGLGIPIILAVGFGIYYLTKKKKTTVKI